MQNLQILPTESESTTDSQPGFGVVQTIATVGGLGYLIRNRVSSESD